MATFIADVDVNALWRPRGHAPLPICARDKRGVPIMGTPLAAGDPFEVPDELADYLLKDLGSVIAGLRQVSKKGKK